MNCKHEQQKVYQDAVEIQHQHHWKYLRQPIRRHLRVISSHQLGHLQRSAHPRHSMLQHHQQQQAEDRRQHVHRGPCGQRHNLVPPRFPEIPTRDPESARPSPTAGHAFTRQIAGHTIMPHMSKCFAGFSVSRPSIRAVGSPSRFAVHACAMSCSEMESTSTTYSNSASTTAMPLMPSSIPEQRRLYSIENTA